MSFQQRYIFSQPSISHFRHINASLAAAPFTKLPNKYNTMEIRKIDYLYNSNYGSNHRESVYVLSILLGYKVFVCWTNILYSLFIIRCIVKSR